jgi:hypothetical protein
LAELSPLLVDHLLRKVTLWPYFVVECFASYYHHIFHQEGWIVLTLAYGGLFDASVLNLEGLKVCLILYQFGGSESGHYILFRIDIEREHIDILDSATAPTPVTRHKLFLQNVLFKLQILGRNKTISLQMLSPYARRRTTLPTNAVKWTYKFATCVRTTGAADCAPCALLDQSLIR